MGSPSFVVERPPVLPLPELGWARIATSLIPLTQPAPPKPISLLLAEDFDEIREIFAFYLTGKGFKVTTTSDGLEAVMMAPELRPDIAVLNNLMPRLSGIEACRRIRAMPCLDGLPIAVYSAKSLGEFEDHALLAGADTCWMSPVDLATFERNIRDTLSGRRRGRNRFRF